MRRRRFAVHARSCSVGSDAGALTRSFPLCCRRAWSGGRAGRGTSGARLPASAPRRLRSGGRRACLSRKGCDARWSGCGALKGRCLRGTAARRAEAGVGVDATMKCQQQHQVAFTYNRTVAPLQVEIGASKRFLGGGGRLRFVGEGCAPGAHIRITAAARSLRCAPHTLRAAFLLLNGRRLGDDDERYAKPFDVPWCSCCTEHSEGNCEQK